MKSNAGTVSKPSNFCVVLKNMLFPDKEQLTIQQLEKFQSIIDKFQKQINEKEESAYKIKSSIMFIKNSQGKKVDIPNKMVMLNNLQNQIRLLFGEIKMLREYQTVFQKAKFKLETLNNTCLVANELKDLQKHVRGVDMKALSDMTGTMSDIDTELKEFDVRMQHASKNMWTEDETALENEFKMFMGEEFLYEDNVVEDMKAQPFKRPEIQQNNQPALAPVLQN